MILLNGFIPLLGIFFEEGFSTMILYPMSLGFLIVIFNLIRYSIRLR